MESLSRIEEGQREMGRILIDGQKEIAKMVQDGQKEITRMNKEGLKYLADIIVTESKLISAQNPQK